MTPGWKPATLISGTGTPTKDRELPLFVGSLLSGWDARDADGRSAQPSSRVSDTLTARERDVLAMISQGLSNKRVVSTAAAQHRHPPQDEALHEKFYSTWYMPDNPARSCCNKADCYPTEIKYIGGNVYARRREDGRQHMKFILVNGRTPRPPSFCALCCEPIEQAYLREIATRLSYCDHQCYLGHRKLAARKYSEARERLVASLNL